MILTRLLDRYAFREWWKVFAVTTLGFPFVAIVLDLTDKLDTYLARGLQPSAIALSYVFSLPDHVFKVIPAAVLFATVFTVGAMGRHSELTAAKAAGVSFYRVVLPVLCAATAAAVLALTIGEIAPQSTRRQLELLGERERQAQNKRFNFAYRADRGWVYVIRSLDLGQRMIRDVQLEREGTGLDYPTIVVTSQRGTYADSMAQWTFARGRLRLLAGVGPENTLAFDSLRLRSFIETPSELLAEAKKPEEMRYVELGDYVDALERSGGDGRKLRVQRALKLAIPATCIIIALFGAPLAITSPRAGGAYGIAISLGTTVVFLILIQLSQAVGASGLLPPAAAAWLPNAMFGAAGLVLMIRAPT